MLIQIPLSIKVKQTVSYLQILALKSGSIRHDQLCAKARRLKIKCSQPLLRVTQVIKNTIKDISITKLDVLIL